jgi:hypothetical protein
MSSHSIYDADRLTHLKIVVVALIGATVVAGVGIAARGTWATPDVITAGKQELVPIVRAGQQPVVVGDRDVSSVR